MVLLLASTTLIHGDRDEFGDVEELRALVNSINDKVPVKLVVIRGTGHFFEGHLDELKTAIYDWVSAQI